MKHPTREAQQPIYRRELRAEARRREALASLPSSLPLRAASSRAKSLPIKGPGVGSF
jgi:hypothetical protein